MSKNRATLQVKYTCNYEKLNEDFDLKIVEFIEKKLKYKWLAQGYDFTNKERDINFEKI